MLRLFHQIIEGFREDLSRGMKRWRKVEIAQTLVSTLIIASLLGIGIYYVWPSVFRHSSPEAVKLVLGLPSQTTMATGEPEIVRVYAANTDGQIDRSRNDIIVLALDPPNSGVMLGATKVTLSNGEATFTVSSTANVVVTLTATWMSGKTPLKTGSVSLNFQHSFR